MEHLPEITMGFTALFVLTSIPMSILVGLRRAKTGVMLLHGDDEDLLRRIRAHANFVEYVPLALLVMAAAEVAQTPDWVVVLACGLVLLSARFMHYVALRRNPSGLGRAIGALLTTCVMFILALATLLSLGDLI